MQGIVQKNGRVDTFETHYLSREQTTPSGCNLVINYFGDPDYVTEYNVRKLRIKKGLSVFIVELFTE